MTMIVDRKERVCIRLIPPTTQAKQRIVRFYQKYYILIGSTTGKNYPLHDISFPTIHFLCQRVYQKLRQVRHSQE